MSKKTFTNKLKKKIVASVIALGLGVASLSGFVFHRPNSYAYAEQGKSIVENYNFKQTSGSSVPASPSTWNKITDDGANTDDITSGVFSSYQANITNNEKYLDNFKLLNTPGHVEDSMPKNEDSDTNGLYRSLMINSPKNEGRMGYESNKFTLNANSYYVVSVTVKTITCVNPDDNTNYSDWDSRASVYLMDKSEESKAIVIDEFSMIDTDNNYNTYEMYVATNEFASASSTLQVYLGGRTSDLLTIGAVFFNSASVTEISRDKYIQQIGNGQETEYLSITDLREGADYNPVINASFEDDYSIGWTRTESDSNLSDVASVMGDSFHTLSEATKHNLTNVKPYTNNSSLNNTHILFMHLSDEGTISLESTPITIKQHGFYKISVWAWCNAGSDTTPSISIKDKAGNVDSVSIDVTNTISSDSESLTNDWKQYSIYVNGSAYEDNEVTVCLNLSTKGTGYVFFDEVTLQTINSKNSTDGQSQSNSALMTFNPDSTSYNVNNYEFNATVNEDNAITYPLAPKSWKQNIDEDNMIGGVINTATSHFDANKTQYAINNGGVPSNPGYVDKLVSNETSNNILMIGSDSASVSGSYTTESKFTAEANKTYRVSLLAHGNVGVAILSDSYYIFDQDSISCNDWKNIEIYFTTGQNGEEINIELSLNNTIGYAYFDCVKIEESSIDAYNLSTAEHKYNIDLTSINFENTNPNNTLTNFFEVNQDASGVKANIVDLSVDGGYHGIKSYNNDNKYALVIDSDNEVTYQLASARQFKLTSGSFYKISAMIKTLDVNNGAYFAIDGEGIEKAFTAINTKLDEYTNQWTEYKFFVRATADTDITLLLGLGNEENPSFGIVLFDDITVTTLEDETAFNSAIANIEDDTTALIVNEIEQTETDNTTEDEEKTGLDGSFNWAIIPSLITALAIFIALFGTLIRKINWKKHAKIKTSYDRAKTVEKDMDRRERIALRQQIIAELNDQIAQIDKEIEEYKAVIKEQEKAVQAKIAEQQRAFIEKKQAITAEKEQLLHERNEKLAKDKNAYTVKAEEEFNSYIKKLEAQEAKQQKIISGKEIALKELHAKRDAKLANYIAKKERIKEEIARVDAEIEEIAKEEARIWEEYKQAKAEAKRQKAEYKAQLKKEKEERLAKKSTKKSDAKEENKPVVDTKAEKENKVETEQENIEITPPDEENK